MRASGGVYFALTKSRASKPFLQKRSLKYSKIRARRLFFTPPLDEFRKLESRQKHIPVNRLRIFHRLRIPSSYSLHIGKVL